MSVIEKLNFADKDERIRRNMFPVKVIKTWGNVTNPDALLNKKDLQITTVEKEVTTLENKAGEPEAAILLDFGTEINGTLRILNFSTVGEARYADVDIKFGESATEAVSELLGEKNATNDHTPRDFSAVVPSFSDQEVGETGFRFAYIRLKSPNTAINLKSVTAVFVYRDLEYKGSFSCNDQLLNEIYDTCAYTCHLSMQRYLWDGIKRDRLVWVGDMYPEMLTIRTVFGSNKVMDDAIRIARQITPLPEWMNGMNSYSLWWLWMVWDWYYYNGDKNFFDENKDYALKLIRQVADYVDYDGSDTFDYDFLDWPTAYTDAGKSGVKGLLVLALIASSKIAEEAGDSALSKECADKVSAMQKRRLDNFGKKQTSAFLALSGLADLKESADFLLSNGAEGMSTFMSYFILKVAASQSMNGALQMLKDYYGGMLSVGATTFWEDFDIKWLCNARPIDVIAEKGEYDIHADNGSYCYVGLRHSFCHGWASAPTAFLAECVLGIKIADKACKKIIISANLGNLEWAKGTYPTPYGILSVSHKKNADGTVSTEYTAPEGVEVQIL